MKTKLLALFVLIVSIGAFGQGPQGINYQAVARNLNGDVLVEKTLAVRIGVYQDDMLIWQEEHSTQTNSLGLFSLTIGNDDVGGSGTAGTFENIQWGSGFFSLKVDVNDGSGYTDFNPYPIQSVPYALYAAKGPDEQELVLSGTELSISGGNMVNLAELPDAVEDADADPHNEIQSLGIDDHRLTISDGNFVDLPDLVADEDADPGNEIQDLMYSGGRISLSNDPTYTSINLPGVIASESGWDLDQDTIVTDRAVEIQTKNPQTSVPLFEVKNDAGIPVFAVYNDGVMVYIDEEKKGVKGGFAVGGYSKTAKGPTQEYLRITPDSTRVYVNDDVVGGKGVKGGFAVGGYSKTAKGLTDNYMEVTRASTHLFFDEDIQTEGKGVKGGFAVGGYSKTKGIIPDQLMSLTPKDYSVNHDAGRLMRLSPQNYFIGHEAGINTTGLYNIFLGYRTGRNNTSGTYNTFFGHESGIVNSSGSYNTFIGYQTGVSNTTGRFNIFLGHSSGFKNTDGEENVYLGYKAGYNSNGDRNVILGNMSGFNSNVSNSVIIGDEAGYNAKAGWGNVFIGQRAGFNNGTGGIGGARNTFVGRNAGEKINSGDSNAFLGAYAGSEAVSGRYNTFLGDGACEVGIPGNGNVYVGYRAGLNNDGASNVVIGREAGSAENYHGLACDFDNNVIIGYRAGFNNKTGNRNVFIGPYAGYTELSSDRLYIDNSSTTSPLIYGDFSGNYLRFNGNIGVNNYYSASYGMMVNGGTHANYSMYVYKGAYTPGTFWSGSDARLKTDIHAIENALGIVMQLRGVRFNWDIDNYPELSLSDDDQIGVIAQEVEAVLPELVPQDPEGFKGVAYGKLTAVLIEAIKEQQEQIDALEKRIAELEK